MPQTKMLMNEISRNSFFSPRIATSLPVLVDANPLANTTIPIDMRPMLGSIEEVLARNATK